MTAVLGPYFANRILELESTRNGWSALIEQDQMIETDREVVMANGESVLVDPVYHTPGELTIADLATRGKADVKDVAYGSMWQTGPSYLKASRETWPVSREFLKPTQSQESSLRLNHDLRLNMLPALGSPSSCFTLKASLKSTESWPDIFVPLYARTRGPLTDT